MDHQIVFFHYVLKNEAGEILDDSHDTEPLSYVEGRHQIIRGLEEGLAGLKSGEKKHVKVEPDKAYGQYDDALVMDLPREQFPQEEKVEVGDQFKVSVPGNSPKIFTVTGVSDQKVSVDGNHPLAGENLYFDVEVTEVRNATPEEIEGDGTHTCCDEEHDHSTHH